MAEQPRVLDVWIVESNTVYKKVPFAVVTDWLQQGRLLEEDQVRPAGTAQWIPLGSMPVFSAYLPKSELYRVEDQAEALEPVQIDFGWKRHKASEDDDVDMIPLIDISLVLLIFFMMTAEVTSGAGSIIDTPEAYYKDLSKLGTDVVWVGIDFRKNNQGEVVEREGQPVLTYSFGQAEAQRASDIADRAELIRGVQALLDEQQQPVRICIRAHRRVLNSVVRDVTGQLRLLKSMGKPPEVFGEVSEKKQ